MQQNIYKGYIVFALSLQGHQPILFGRVISMENMHYIACPLIRFISSYELTRKLCIGTWAV